MPPEPTQARDWSRGLSLDPIRETPGEAAPAIFVELVAPWALVRHQVAWADLCGRALEPNVFLEPAFALPLLQHVHVAQRPVFLLAWEDGGATSFERLLAVVPVVLPRGQLGPGMPARNFTHQQTACGTPLVDRARADAVLPAILDWLHGHVPHVKAIVFDAIETSGRFAAALRHACATSGRSIAGIDAHTRAVFDRAKAARDVSSMGSARRRKERARQDRRLSEAGRRTYASARTPTEIAVAIERFLALEYRGWKGRRGTALLSTPALATFARTMARLMAHEARCRIDSLEIDGKPVAMGIVVTSGDRACFWKTTYDERFSALSPGVQFAMDLTRRLRTDASIALTDSCAVEDHPMINRLWPGRMEMTSLVVSIDPASRLGFRSALALEKVRRGLRRRMKTLWRRVGRPRSG